MAINTYIQMYNYTLLTYVIFVSKYVLIWTNHLTFLSLMEI